MTAVALALRQLSELADELERTFGRELAEELRALRRDLDRLARALGHNAAS